MIGIAGPHFPSLETLALAIEAQGSHAPDHLLRANYYAVELARRLGLDQFEMEILHLAAILHDVGELAVPQSILSKSGDLTPHEFEKMKTHPTVGAQIVERAGLPPPAITIVRSHHERWDGCGYPDCLRGPAIPLGARILAVADCLAGVVPETLQAGIGTLYDPEIALVAAGIPAAPAPEPLGFRATIIAAQREERLLCRLTGELGNSLSLPETLSAFDCILKELISYHCIALYRVQDNRLTPAYVNGESAQRFGSLEVPFGEGPCGVAAATCKPVLSGHPEGHPDGDTGCPVLALPLESNGEAIAVLALYHAAPDAFTAEDLRILLTVRDKLALTVEHALHEERTEQLAAVDPLTGLPNRRALFQRLDAELARCRRNRSTLALLVCEIEGLPSVHPLYKPIAAGLRQICREDDCVARMEDGFVLALGGFWPRDLTEKRHLIESLLRELAPSESLILRIGAAYYPDDGDYAEDLLACADIRLTEATAPKHETRRE